MTGPLHIEVSDLADRQIREADRWWRKNREKAPNAIREELERIGALIASGRTLARVRRARINACVARQRQ